MSISTEIISGLMVEQADTPVLGTGLARGESSNLSKPTTVEYLLLGCVNCCDNSMTLPKGKEKLAELLGKVQCTCLRKMCQLSFRNKLLNYYLIPTLILEKSINISINRGAEDQATYATCLGNHAVLQMSFIRCSKNEPTSTN